MNKFLIGLALAAALLVGGCKMISNANAQECLKPAQLVLMANSQGLRNLALDGDSMTAFMTKFEETHAKAPVEYDLIVVINDEENSQIVLFKDGCKVTQTRVLPADAVTSILKEAGN